MLLNARGHRIAPSEITARLHQIAPELGMVWIPQIGAFALTYTWPENDPRRAEIRAGKRDESTAYDVFGYAPPDVTVEEAYHCLVAGLKRNSGSSADALKLLDRVYAYNKEQEERNLKPTMDFAEEMIEYNAPHLFADTLDKRTIRHFVTDRRGAQR